MYVNFFHFFFFSLLSFPPFIESFFRIIILIFIVNEKPKSASATYDYLRELLPSEYLDTLKQWDTKENLTLNVCLFYYSFIVIYLFTECNPFNFILFFDYLEYWRPVS